MDFSLRGVGKLGVVFVLVTLTFSSVAVYSKSRDSATPNTPIDHIVVIMQENHSFDNLFGTYPGLSPKYSLPLGDCVPVNLTDSNDGCVLPWNADSNESAVEKLDLCHSPLCMRTGYDKGQMNGFVDAQVAAGNANANDTMAYVTGATVPDYWDLASTFALDANFFSSVLSNSWPNHVYNVAAQGPLAGGCPNDCMFNLTFPTIINDLTAGDVSWGYYTGAFNDSLQCQPITTWQGLGSGVSGSYWNVLPDFPAVQDNPATCHNIGNFNDLYKALNKGTLPQVTWIMPNYTVSDHPGGNAPLAKGQEWVAQIIDQIESNKKLWDSTAIFLTWDEGGGYFDSVTPDRVRCRVCGSDLYGIRVPLIVVSPYVTPGTYYGNPSGKEEDFSSLLKTIEDNWGLPSLTNRDASVSDLFYMFNFSQKPSPPLILPTSSLAEYPVSACSSCQYSANGLTQFVPTQPLPPMNASAIAQEEQMEQGS